MYYNKLSMWLCLIFLGAFILGVNKVGRMPWITVFVYTLFSLMIGVTAEAEKGASFVHTASFWNETTCAYLPFHSILLVLFIYLFFQSLVLIRKCVRMENSYH